MCLVHFVLINLDIVVISESEMSYEMTTKCDSSLKQAAICCRNGNKKVSIHFLDPFSKSRRRDEIAVKWSRRSPMRNGDEEEKRIKSPSLKMKMDKRLCVFKVYRSPLRFAFSSFNAEI